MVTIITGTTSKHVTAERLKEFFRVNNQYNGYLYIGYPVIGTSAGPYPVDALWVSKDKGIVAFHLVEGKALDSYEDTQDEYANKIESKLLGYKEIVKKRDLMVEVNVVTFAPTIQQFSSTNEGYYLCNEENLNKILSLFAWNSSEYYERVLSILQTVSSIRKGRNNRDSAKSGSRGEKLKKLEDSISNLDNQQSRAVIETVEGVQRIRGLAGSGKTIVLALKAAYLHAQHPKWKIAVTFNTRALKGQFKTLINTFHIEQTLSEPDWKNLEIINAWGAPGGNDKSGIYFDFCMEHNTNYLDYQAALQSYGRSEAFNQVCERALSEVEVYKPKYDVILIDEAQDFSSSFLRMCYEFLNEPKRLIYAYDELQNLNNQSLPGPEIIFGNLSNGKPRVEFRMREEGQPQQDIILEKCYRNSRPALVTAHALGFGIYRKENPVIKTGLVQMFDQSSLWKDIGYEIVSGKLEDGKQVVLERTQKGSPTFLEQHSDIDDLLLFKSFSTQREQDLWIAEEIEKNLKNDDLQCDDIIVINPNPLTTRERVAPIRSILFSKGIQSHTAGIDTSPDVFFVNERESVAFTGIFRAKGNEAAMVYVINAQTCYNSKNEMAKIRNQLFTAITRSKAWVRIVGVGDEMDELIAEYERIKQNRFTLDFKYPTSEQRKYLNIVNRDMSEAEKKKVNNSKQSVMTLIDSLEKGDIFLEDLGLDPEQVKKLRDLLKVEDDVY